jgi:UDP-N-acetylglucosamine 2-epimerase (non-hydrolysing)
MCPELPETKRPLLVVAGTRPEVIKLTPVLKWLERLNLEYVFVWSGQHYDYELSRVFFEQLGIPDPDGDLDVRSGTHAEQTAKVMIGLERMIKKYSPSVLVAEGDTNTVVASSLASSKCLVPFAHVEAGLRSWNMCMPEEVNRKIADAVASLHFAPTELAAMNLLLEGASSKSVHVTGNTIVDMVNEYESLAKEKSEDLLSELGLEKYSYILVTIHRAENTESPQRLANIVRALKELSQHYDILFSVHPRTKRRLIELNLMGDLEHVKMVKPMGYLEFLGVLAYARVVLTDSGGVQEEAFTLKVPTVILRYNTERPETTMFRISVLAGADKDRIVKSALAQAERAERVRRLSFKNPLGDGSAGKRIVQVLREAVESGLTIEEPDLRETPVIEYRLLAEGEIKSQSLFDLLVAFSEDGRPLLPEKSTSRFLARIKSRFDDKDPLNSE